MVPYDKMPGILDHRTGKKLKSNLLLSTKNLSRGLARRPAQGHSGSDIHIRVDILVQDRGDDQDPEPKGITPVDKRKQDVLPPKDEVLINSKTIGFGNTTGEVRMVNTSYGIIRVI
ncbi:hypothetical protein ACHAPQ_006026 [Fusarium lateritium]